MPSDPPDSGPEPLADGSLDERLASPTTPILIAGPTGVGKSALAMALADRLGGEIVSVDSMQVYRGLNIGTAKPSLEERNRIPHHLIDVVEITSPFDAAQFARLAHLAVADIQQRGRVPILCGGTGLYFKAFVDGIGSGPPPDPGLRAELEARSPTDLLAELKQCDPETFARIDRNNPRRVIRALEVIRLSGRRFPDTHSRWHAERVKHGAREFFGLWRSAGDLRVRIDERVDRMFAQGLIQEVAELRTHGLEENRTAMQAIGYRQVLEHLQGLRSVAETIELVKQRTRQFAKRQMTWFRRQVELEWIDVSGQSDTSIFVENLLGPSRKLEL